MPATPRRPARPDASAAGTAAGTGRLHQIGEVAEAVGLSIRTIRHYDEIGIVPPSGRSPGGFGLYTDDDMDRLRLVMQMKPLDFTLEESVLACSVPGSELRP